MSEDAKETKRGNRIARAALQVTCIIFIAGWMFSVERNTARTATATEFFKTRLPVIEVIISENREGLTKATTRLDSHDKRLDDHQRIIEIITAPIRNPE